MTRVFGLSVKIEHVVTSPCILFTEISLSKENLLRTLKVRGGLNDKENLCTVLDKVDGINLAKVSLSAVSLA